MALITASEIKNILGITGTEKDDQLTAIVPLLPRLITSYCNDLFLNKNIYISSSGISFATLTISDSNEGFVDAKFVKDMDIYVSGSLNNNGVLLISSSAISASAMVMDSNEDNFTAEDAGAGVTIYQVQYPEEIKIPVAHFTNYMMENSKGVESERIGDYSVKFASKVPPLIRDLFKHYRRPKWA